MLQSLTHQHDPVASLDASFKQLHAINFQVGLQLVLEVFLAQQVQAVAADSAQHSVHAPGGKDTVGGIKKWPQDRHQQHHPAPYPALQKCLRVPGKKGDGADRSQVCEAAFHSPVDRGGGVWIVVGRFQIVFVPILRGRPRLRVETYCKQSSQKGEEGSAGISRVVTVWGGGPDVDPCHRPGPPALRSAPAPPPPPAGHRESFPSRCAPARWCRVQEIPLNCRTN